MNKRLIGLAIAIFFLFSVLIAQFFRIQVIEGEKWSKKALKQHFFIVSEPFMRGSFYSNTTVKKNHPEKEQPFVIDIQKFHLYVDPDSIPVELRDTITSKLTTMLDLSPEELKLFREQFDKKSRSRKLAMWLERETRDAIMKWWLPYASKEKIARNAIFFVSDYQRSYPFGKLLGQVLHTVQSNKDEVSKQAVPTGGLELYFNKYLKGKEGKRRLMRSPRNSFETGEVIVSPENGADIYLTINHFLQAIAEEELEKGVKKAKAKCGWTVMMNPRTGEILALAQYPFFYPAEYPLYFTDKDKIEHTKIKALTDANEPGSVMKPITVAIGLKANADLTAKGEAPLFDPEEKMPVSNGRFRGRSKPIRDTRLHHFLNMNMAIQKSSNIYMGRIIERVIDRLGENWYRQQLVNFGFGTRTRLELPAESPGLLPTPGKKHPSGVLEWSVPTPFSIAMGHNIQANTIQILRAHAVFANGGYLVQPTIVRKIVKTHPDGHQEVLIDNTTEERIKSFPRVLDQSIVDRTVEAMKYATKKGGAVRADIPGYTEAGKSGTPEKIVNGRYTSEKHCPSYVGFAPVKDSAFVLIVTIDEPEVGYEPGVGKKHMGGQCAAPVFRDISKRALEYLGIAPDDPYGYPAGDPRSNPEKAEWGKETRLLQEKYNSWNIPGSN